VASMVLIQLLLVLMFAWPASRSGPHGLPVAVSGPASVTRSISTQLAGGRSGALDVTVVSSAGAARRSVLDRSNYGAVVFGPDSVTVYVASAAGPAVAAQLSTQLVAALKSASPAISTVVVDLAPSPRRDPSGAGLTLSLIPFCVTSVLLGSVVGLFVRRRRYRYAALAAFSLAAGVLSTLGVQTALGVMFGSWSANASVLALAALALSAPAAGLASTLRAPGAAVALLVLFFGGFAFSGATSAWQFVPAPWGRIDQAFPVGALSTTQRSVAFFNGAHSSGGLLVLSTWSIAGLVLAWYGRGKALENDRTHVR
jgi:hypothetical protein